MFPVRVLGLVLGLGKEIALVELELSPVIYIGGSNPMRLSLSLTLPLLRSPSPSPLPLPPSQAAPNKM